LFFSEATYDLEEIEMEKELEVFGEVLKVVCP
jgi:hypothetical protein